MSCSRTYYCNLCNKRYIHEIYGPPQLLGLEKTKNGLVVAHIDNADVHICVKCLSSLQKFTEICVGGYDCAGGPTCTSDHN